jgi:hypothetical protein
LIPHLHPPPGWPQRVRRGLPFAPGRDGEEFETYLEAGVSDQWDRYEINISTLEVFQERGERWNAPGWLELPPRLRARIWTLSGQAPPPSLRVVP